MKINGAGRKIIEDHEGCRLEAYKCPAGIWTIGYGHAIDVKPWDKITQHQADVILDTDLHFLEQEISRLCPSANANQFSALVSFAYNVGIGIFEHSSLLRKFQAGDIQGAADEFPKWVHANGEVLPGLVRRREDERALFLTVPS